MHNPNLLPANAIRLFQRKRFRALWFKTAGLALLTALTCIFIGQSQASKKLAYIETLQLAASQTRDMQTRLQQHVVSYRRMHQLKERQAELRSRYSPLTVLELLHDCKEQLNGKLQVVALEYVDESGRPREHRTTAASNVPVTSGVPVTSRGAESSKGGESSKGANGHIQLRLVTEGSTQSSAVLQCLQASGYFDEVKLISSLEQVEAGRLDLQFTIRCTF